MRARLLVAALLPFLALSTFVPLVEADSQLRQVRLTAERLWFRPYKWAKLSWIGLR